MLGAQMQIRKENVGTGIWRCDVNLEDRINRG